MELSLLISNRWLLWFNRKLNRRGLLNIISPIIIVLVLYTF